MEPEGIGQLSVDVVSGEQSFESFAFTRVEHVRTAAGTERTTLLGDREHALVFRVAFDADGDGTLHKGLSAWKRVGASGVLNVDDVVGKGWRSRKRLDRHETLIPRRHKGHSLLGSRPKVRPKAAPKGLSPTPEENREGVN